MTTPAIIIAGTHSGSGKTTVTLGVLAALARRGLQVQGFKVGPDFIDPGHHARFTGRPGRNLDSWMLGPEALATTYRNGTEGADIAVIEGAMGLFDGLSALDEAGSTADLARLWDLPVVLVVDARGLARSIVPLVQGFAQFDEGVRVRGVVANKVGSQRHFDEYLAPALRSSASGIERLGYLMRHESLTIPSRHLGLLTAEELLAAETLADRLADAVENSLDIDGLIALAQEPKLSPAPVPAEPESSPGPVRRVRLAVARDAAFCFYYQDNLDLFRAAGAEVVPFSPLGDTELPAQTELVYLGGGYPEIFAGRLAENQPMRDAMRRFHAQGGTILAECGGLMACSESLRDVSGAEWPMWGLIPGRVQMQRRFAALGYVTIASQRETPLGPPGTQLRGHEFHYSTLESRTPLPYTTRLQRPGRESRPDGIQIGSLFAAYAHMHLGSNPEVAARIVRAAR